MPLFHDEKTDKLFAVCEHCQLQSELTHEKLDVAVMLLQEKGWVVSEGGDFSACCKQHWDDSYCTEALDKYDIEHLEEILSAKQPRSD